MAGKPNKHEWYIDKLKEAWGDEFVCLEEYKGSRTPINHLHIPCGIVKPIRTDHLLGKGKNRRGCRKCNNVRRTHEQFLEEIKEIHGDNIEIIGKYTLSHERVTIIHKKCGMTRNPFAGNLLQGYTGCRPCALEEMWDGNSLTQDEFENKVKAIHEGDVIPLGSYSGVRDRMDFLHVTCGRTWNTQTGNVVNGHSCVHCAVDSKRLTEDGFRQRLYEVYQDEIEWTGGIYENYRSILSFKNIKCGHEFDRMVAPTLNTAKLMVNNCPRCGGSKGEHRIEKFLSELSIDYKAEHRFNDCRNKNPLPFDFAILEGDLSIKAVIEFDGQEHFEPVEYFGGEEKYKMRIKNDQIKNDYCKQNNINLIRIPYWDYDNIETILEEALGLVAMA